MITFITVQGKALFGDVAKIRGYLFSKMKIELDQLGYWHYRHFTSVEYAKKNLKGFEFVDLQ